MRYPNNRQQAIEMMQMRSAFTAQLQGVDTVQTQSLKQIEAKHASAAQLFNPAIHMLEQQSHFNVKQLESLADKVLNVEGVQIPAIQNMANRAESLLRENLSNGANVKLAGLAEELKLHQMRIEELHEAVLSNIADASAQIAAANGMSESADKSIAVFQREPQLKIHEIGQKLQTATAKVSKFHSAANTALAHVERQSRHDRGTADQGATDVNQRGGDREDRRRFYVLLAAVDQPSVGGARSAVLGAFSRAASGRRREKSKPRSPGGSLGFQKAGNSPTAPGTLASLPSGLPQSAR
jgi:hypothetical protein